MMVECEHGMEERSLGGQVNLARSPAQSPGAAQGSSYFNRQEAILAIRQVGIYTSQSHLTLYARLNQNARS